MRIEAAAVLTADDHEARALTAMGLELAIMTSIAELTGRYRGSAGALTMAARTSR